MTIERGANPFPGNKHLLKAASNIYDASARQFASEQQWKEAIAVYSEGLQQYPGDSHLKHNAIFTWDSWAKIHIDEKDWLGAI